MSDKPRKPMPKTERELLDALTECDDAERELRNRWSELVARRSLLMAKLYALANLRDTASK